MVARLACSMPQRSRAPFRRGFAAQHSYLTSINHFLHQPSYIHDSPALRTAANNPPRGIAGRRQPPSFYCSLVCTYALVDQIVLMAGDSDFVPAAKLARKEGIDVALDPMWQPMSDDLLESIDGLRSTTPNSKTKGQRRGCLRASS